MTMSAKIDRKLILIVVCSVAIIVALIFLINYIVQKSRPGYSFVVTPISAKVEYCGKELSILEGAADCKEGKLKLSADGFDSIEEDIKLKNFSSQKVERYLRPSDGNIDAYLANRRSYEILKTIAKADDAEVNDFLRKTEKMLSVKDILPLSFEFEEFGKIRDGAILFLEDDSRCEKFFCLEVSSNRTNEAKVELEKSGYNLSDYEVIK